MKEKPLESYNKNEPLPKKIEGFDSLTELALDIRSSWNHLADEVWKQLNPAMWEISHNPWKVPQTAPLEEPRILWQG